MKGDPYSTLVPDGRYSAAFVGLEKGVVYGQRRWFGYFQITDLGPYHGCTLVRFWNEPRSRFLPRTHNLSLDFVALIGRRPPSSGLKPDAFLKGCEVLVEVLTVKHRSDGHRKVLLPEDLWYSKIDRLIRITAGVPPCGLSRGSR